MEIIIFGKIKVFMDLNVAGLSARLKCNKMLISNGLVVFISKKPKRQILVRFFFFFYVTYQV